VTSVSRGIDRIEVTFDDPHLVANAGLLLVATLVVRLRLERLINEMVDLSGRVGGALPGRKVLTLVHAMVAGGSHIDHADVLRSGATQAVLPHRVMAPSTLGTFLGAFTFGHVRQLDRVLAEALRRAWALGAGSGEDRLVVDLDSTICEVSGKEKQGAGYGYTHRLGYHPLLATRAATGEVLHARMRKGAANTQRGTKRFIEELVARLRRAGATGELIMRFDSGFWSNATLTTLVGLFRPRPRPHPVGGPPRRAHPEDQLVVARTVRTRFLSIPGCLVNRSGRPTLRAPLEWPWAETFCRALNLLRTLPPVPV
jgi:hypothetical protein